jgi:two-component system response regulator FixJ
MCTPDFAGQAYTLKNLGSLAGGKNNAILSHGITVFIVEDDDAARHSLAASLEALGCSVRTFASCEAFLAQVNEVGPGCLLLDYHFKGLSGLELLDLLRDAGISIPTVLFTGRFGALLRHRAVEFPSIVAILDKPLEGRQLLNALYRASRDLNL